MASIAVLDHNQRETDRARRFVKRSAGKSLVRRAMAYWVKENAILRMLGPLETRVVRDGVTTVFYIPANLPPVELPGIFFEPPQSSAVEAPSVCEERARKLAEAYA